MGMVMVKHDLRRCVLHTERRSVEVRIWRGRCWRKASPESGAEYLGYAVALSPPIERSEYLLLFRRRLCPGRRR